MENIPLWPLIPERLRIAARTGALVPFIGAGVSQLAGCPGWDDFATQALRFFVDENHIDNAQFDQLSQLAARVKLSIAVGLEQRYQVKIDFDSMLDAATPAEKTTGKSLYRHLGALGTVFVTTNYDRWLDRPLGLPATADEGAAMTAPSSAPTVLHDPRTFTGEALSRPGTVIHIHGSVEDRSNMLLTTSDYLKRYAGHRLVGSDLEENGYLTFLDILFRTKSVLFVGYGLSELEILEYVIQKSKGITQEEQRRGTQPSEPRHYLLQGFYSHEIRLMHNLEDYYRNECGIGLIPYLKDQKGWKQLIDVLEYLAKEIPVGKILPSQRRTEMRELLE